MLRSMYSGISGLKNFQTKLDVIGNNIANVNTHGFKKGRVIFKDLMSQTQAGASGPSLTAGGTNAQQVGLGSSLATIDTIHGSGSRQNTGRVLDIAVEGEGFFMVAKYNPNGDSETIAGESFDNVAYTRAGNFYMDQEGFLVDASGNYVVGMQGWEGLAEDDQDLPLVEEDGTALEYESEEWEELQTEVVGTRIRIPTDAKSMSIGADGKVTFTDSEGLKFAGQIVMAKFPNAEGLTKIGNNYYEESANSGAVQIGVGNTYGIGKTVSGSLEMSNVDLSEEFTEMIVAQRGFQANTRIITTSDEILQELVNLKR
ncbi:flagellar basal body rod protein FlgG [Lysinibacillus contaminans]|uniref:Flagellar hook protein FlgE n=1 Tax=Lysinibacillus contaminans TaxID=1293441 RepID=A0ABR5K407_9BACI|nr:flagellar basal body rod protein FlgG [Lysinibacillus contaminans]KOS69462.1 flagellar basal body rod protein FlgG [Lysinibacillus contaminans]